ncbi:hypothetical protein Y032_0001g256 [Ancylostoma ceylanicum]|uniref:Uncharacterized protein n=1 Tax=Ancylostoma ceylanicum TaxID=53326 RepID=A0A016W4B9_9BILA|nr:hypothetical protein Y032_0001g256 [Ancylostoma ceylanicum]
MSFFFRETVKLYVQHDYDGHKDDISGSATRSHTAEYGHTVLRHSQVGLIFDIIPRQSLNQPAESYEFGEDSTHLCYGKNSEIYCSSMESFEKMSTENDRLFPIYC